MTPSIARAARSLRDGDLAALRPGRRTTIVAGAIAVVVTAALMIAGVPVGPVVMLALVVPPLWWAVRALAPASDRRAIGRIAGLVFATHVVGSTVLFAASYLAGHGGFYFGDDIAYAHIGRVVAEYIRGTGDPTIGPPTWDGDAYLLSAYGIMVAAIFTVLGPQILSVEFVNAGFMTLAVVLLYTFVARIFGKRAALVAAVVGALYPSVQLWTMTNLKDALSLFLAMALLDAASRYQARPRLTPLLVVLAACVPLISLRVWLFYLLAVSVVAAIALTTAIRSLPRRAMWAGGMGVALFLLLQLQASNALRNSFSFESLAVVRRAMASTAKSGFGGATPLPITVSGGTTLLIVTPSPPLVAVPSGTIPPSVPSGVTPVILSTPTPAPTASQPATPSVGPSGSGAASSARPTASGARPSASARAFPSPTTIVVSPGTRLVLAPTAPPPAATTPPPPAGAVYVQPGDLVVVLAEGATPGPDRQQQKVVVSKEEDTVTIGSNQLLTRSVLEHAPIGLVYALFAPFPWAVTSVPGLGVSAEMLLWYVFLAACAWTVWTERAAWRAMAPAILFVLGVLAVFALVEGNLGTLFRHRAMIVLPVVAIGAATLTRWLARTEGRVPPRLLAAVRTVIRELS